MANSHYPAKAARKKIIIAIDGPAGSGKSTLASVLAQRYNYLNIETGAMYRALALKAIQAGVSLDDAAALAVLTARSRIELLPQPEGNRVLLDGMDVTGRIRQQEVTEAASKVSVHPQVRAWMVREQRRMGAAAGIVMEGRDIGTQVFPEAEVKIFLDAAPEVRGTRRQLQHPQPAQGNSVLAELQERDQRDRTRMASPLLPAADAVVIDSTHLSLEEVVEKAVTVIEQKLQKLERLGN